MMRKALVASIGMAAMLALAACSGDGKVSQSLHDAALADRDELRSDLAGVRSDLAEAKAGLEAARARLQEADDDYVLAEQRARAAQQAAAAAQRAYENGALTRTQLEKARADAVAARDAANAARLAADAARTTATMQSAALQRRVNLMTRAADLPTGQRGITAQTPDLTLNPGETKIIGNVRFACDADSPDAAACTVAFVPETNDDGEAIEGTVQFRRNVVLVTATLISDPLAERLLIATTNTATTGAVLAYAYPEDGGDESTGKLTTYIREMGASNAYTVTVGVDGDPLAGVATADRTKNLYRFYAGEADDRPDGHAELTALTDLKVEASTGLITGWSLASLDGVDGVDTNTVFGAGDSELPEGERWTKSWMVEGEALPGGRVIDLDAYTNRKKTRTVGKTDAGVDEAFSNAADRAAVKGALSDDGYQLVSGDGAVGTDPDGDNDDLIPARFAYQLEIDAESDVTISTGVDESKRIRVSAIPGGATESSNYYLLSALSTAAGGTPAWFYGIPGRVVCGGTPTDCGDEIIARPEQLPSQDPPGQFYYRESAAGADGGLRFHANDGDHEFYVPDTDWVSIGVWAVRPAAGAMVADVQMGAFVHGGQPWNFGNGTTGVTNAQRAAAGKVDYVGDAVGRYAERDGDAAAVTGRFTATANLTFDLAWDDTAASDTDSGGLSGRITDFRLDGKDDEENWRLTLANTNAEQLFRSAPLLSGTCGANTAVSIGGSGTCGSAGLLAGAADGTVMQGRLNARAFGPYVAGTATTHTPTAIAGTFLAEPGVVRSNHDLSLVGAFLAGRKPAAATE